MAISFTTGACNNLAYDIGHKIHDLAADTIKIALYTTAGAVGASTGAYTATNELSSSGYSAGGLTLSSVSLALFSTSKAHLTFTDPSWTGLTGTVRSFLIYNDTPAGNNSLFYGTLASDAVLSASDFTIDFTADPLILQ